MAMARVLVLPVAASAERLVATPGSEVGAKVTVPSMAETAEEDWVARSSEEPQRPCGGRQE